MKMQDADPIDQLRELGTLAELGALPPHISPFVVTFVHRYLAAGEARRPISLEMAMGIAEAGRHRWWTKQPKARRNKLLCELRRQRFPHLVEPWAAARAIDGLLRRQAIAPEDDQLVRLVLQHGGAMIQLRQLARVLA